MFILGGLLLTLDPRPSKFPWLWIVTWTPLLRIPVGIGGMVLFGALAVLRVRLWRGEPLVEVTGERMTMARLWGRTRIDRADIAALVVWTRAQQLGLEVQLMSGKRRRIGFQPSGTNWYRVVEELDEWMVD